MDDHEELPAFVGGRLVDTDVSDPLEALIAGQIATDTPDWKLRAVTIAEQIRAEYTIAARWPDHEPRRTRAGWYRFMPREWATARFRFPSNPDSQQVHIAGDGSEWTYELNTANEWEISAYAPGGS